MHLNFIRKRKADNDKHFAQIVRLLKFWAQLEKRQNEEFRLKSFMIEMIVAYLADRGTTLNDYPEGSSVGIYFSCRRQFPDIYCF